MTIVTPDPQTVREAAVTLKRGGVVAFATETVYGLGCDTFNTDAIKKVYALKGRPLCNPMIAHVQDVSWIERLSDQWDEQCDNLAKQFWPGGLTIILPRHKDVPPSACGGFDTIAIRCPSHPVAQQLLSIFGGPISAPSANRSGYISPTTATHVEDEFKGAITVLDGGPCSLGIESTVLSMVDEPTVLRLGSITNMQLEQVIGLVRYEHIESQMNSPGTTTRHYAPTCPVVLVPPRDMENLDDENCVAIVINTVPKRVKRIYHMPTTPHDYAVRMYAVLRDADAGAPSRIVIERPPKSPVWDAVTDRLVRCSTNG